MKRKREQQQESILMVLRPSRKSFLVEYGVGVFLLVLLMVSVAKGVPIPALLKKFALGLALFAFISPEIVRMFTRYKITPTKISIIKGIFKQAKKNVHFHPLGFIPEINMKQSRIQRVLNYGTIFVHGTGQNSFEVKDVDHPQKLLDIFEELIDKSRGSM